MTKCSIKLMKRLVSVLMLVSASAGAVLAQERQFTNYNCAITPADGWKWMTNLPASAGAVAVCSDASRTRMVLLVIPEQYKPSGPLDDRFISDYDAGVSGSDGGRRLSGKYIEIAGIRSYERVGTALVKGKQASTIIRLVPTKNFYYSVEAMRFNGDAGEDSGIMATLDSFRFITPPEAPVWSPLRDSAAFKTGYMIGRYGTFAAVIIGGVVIGASILVRSRTTRSQRPPPLPPNARR